MATALYVGGEVIEKPCDADPNMEGIQECVKLEKRPSRPDDNVQGVQTRQAPAVRAAVAPVQVEGAALPFTAGQVASFLFSALGLIGAGGLLLLRRR